MATFTETKFRREVCWHAECSKKSYTAMSTGLRAGPERGGGTEVRRPEINKVCLAELQYLFHNEAPGRVQGPHILAPCGTSRVSTSMKDGTT